jgi:nucleoside-diphosphate-sugar epimerase
MNWSSLAPRPGFLAPFAGWAALPRKRIGITGGKGLLGRLLAARLSDAGLAPERFDGDVLAEGSLHQWVNDTRPAIVFNLAAVVPLDVVSADPVRAMRVNACSTATLAAAIASQADPAWLFHASSSHVYSPPADSTPIDESSTREPSSFYGCTKLAGENILMPLASQTGIQLCVGRIFSYFHETQPTSFLVPGLVERVTQLNDGGTLELRDAASVRDFLHAESVVDALLHLAAARATGVVNIGSGASTRVDEMARRVLALLGKRAAIVALAGGSSSSLVADVSRLEGIISGSVP